MKLRKNREIIVFIILIPVFLWAALFISSRLENNLPSYSTLNKASTGTSVFYECLRQLKFPVDRTLKPVDKQDINSVQVIASGGNFDINSYETKAWVEKGGTLVHLSTDNLHIIDYAKSGDTNGKIITFKYGKGTIIGADVTDITNKTLLNKTDNAYEIAKELGSLNKKIYFNEAYLYGANTSESLWDYVPLWGKFMIFQLLLILTAFFYYKGKRFEKPLELYEETERSENEYLYSASSLYRQAKCYDLIVENYYNNLLRKINRTSEEFLDYWDKEELPSLNKAKQVYDFMQSLEVKRKPKEYIQIVSIIEQLDNILNKRRDSYWKALRK